MSVLDSLFQGSPPPAVNLSAANTNGLPDWYQQYLSGIAGKATELAGANLPVPQMAVSDFSPDEIAAQDLTRQNVGKAAPYFQSALSSASSVAPAVNGMVGNAQTAVSGPAQSWTSSFPQYMSPYTQSVVDNIGRLGAQDFNERIMPGINASMIGAGQFGSTRNADVLARAGRDMASNILGQQSNALQAGYGTSANIFGADANRAQQQQQLQAGTALTGASTLGGTLTNNASQLGALSQAYQQSGANDAQMLNASGQNQRQLAQAGLDTTYTNAVNNNQADWTTLNNLRSTVSGLPLPSNQVNTTNAPASVYQPGALQQVGQAYGLLRAGS